jgi:hypothetical protein
MGHLLKIKCIDSRENVHILASTSVPFTLTTVQVPNLALTLTKWITVYKSDLTDYLLEYVQESLLSSASSRTSSPGEEDRMQHTMDMDILQVGAQRKRNETERKEEKERQKKVEKTGISLLRRILNINGYAQSLMPIPCLLSNISLPLTDFANIFAFLHEYIAYCFFGQISGNSQCPRSWKKYSLVAL